MTARTADALLDLLADLALAPGSADPSPSVACLAWGGHTPESLAAAWEPFREAVRLREQVATGERDWRYADPDAADLGDALDRQSALIHAAYPLLAYGPAATT